jgi:hypothetical protein
MRARSFAAVVSCALAAAALTGATPRKIAVVESLEWMAVSADHVAAGTVMEVKAVSVGGRAEYEAVTVATSKTYKGTHADRLTVLLWADSASIAKAWKDDDVPLLFFLSKNGDENTPPKCDWSLARSGTGRYSAVRLGHPDTDRTMPACTREYEILTKSDAITKRVEEALKSAPKGGKPESKRVKAPEESAVFKRFYARSSVELVVPAE